MQPIKNLIFSLLLKKQALVALIASTFGLYFILSTNAEAISIAHQSSFDAQPFALDDPPLTASVEEAGIDRQASEQSPLDDVLIFPMWVAGSGEMQPYQSRFTSMSSVGGIAIVYPDISEPFRSVFMQIIDGIESRVKGRVANFPIKDNVSANELLSNLKDQNTKIVIALGQHGLKLAMQLEGEFNVVAGGVLDYQAKLPRNIQVNSLLPDPALLFSRLKTFLPRTQKVYVIYNPKSSAWIIQLAKNAAKLQGLSLVTYEADSIKDAVAHYQEIFEKMDGKQDALWLLQDSSVVDERTILPLVLQASWSQDLPVFSSNFSHVKRGVLFSLYPDNSALGRYLAGSAMDMLRGSGREMAGLLPLREVLVAVNARTARHLGLELNPQTHHFDISFPER